MSAKIRYVALLFIGIGVLAAFAVGLVAGSTKPSLKGTALMSDPALPVQKKDEEWRAALTPEQYQILRHKGTERAFTGEYWNHHEKGMYHCAGCGVALFDSNTKYDSGSGWPSFWEAVDPKRVKLVEDRTYGMVRIEVECAACGGHLGHVFSDGPQPTGERYCINSASLKFKK